MLWWLDKFKLHNKRCYTPTSRTPPSAIFKLKLPFFFFKPLLHTLILTLYFLCLQPLVANPRTPSNYRQNRKLYHS